MSLMPRQARHFTLQFQHDSIDFKQGFTNMKVLLIEDEKILANVLREKLKEAKCVVDIATDGEMGLEMAAHNYPDLIILDLILPKKDGFEVLKELKTHTKLKTIPVLVLSNLGQDEDIKKVINLGAVDYLVKTQHHLNEVVKKAIEIMTIIK